MCSTIDRTVGSDSWVYHQLLSISAMSSSATAAVGSPSLTAMSRSISQA
jgi:hypothetical protein